MPEVSAQRGSNVPNREMQVAFVKSEKLLRGYFPTLQDVDLEKRFLREPAGYERRGCRVFAEVSFGFFKDTENSFVLAPRVVQEGGGI